jgi:SAM-dependent MidA family methyltransferase
VTVIHQILLQRLSLVPRLSFASVMELALYDSEHGYYGPGPRRIGREGDFYTAVSVGPLYGRLLAGLAVRLRSEMGAADDFKVIEQAAHDGQLAEDILESSDLDYLIVEPNPRYQEVQRQRLGRFAERVSWVAATDDLPAGPALFACNELPDAMPVHLVRWDGSEWQELFVTAEASGRLQLAPGPPSASLAVPISRLPRDLRPGHTLEINLAAEEWLRQIASARFHGQVVIADYGLDEEEFWAPERAGGTLRRYHQHQMDDRVLEDLGECDLTSHVNFSRLLEVAAAEGLRLKAYEHQGRWLGRLAMPWLASLEGRPQDASTKALLRQFQSLTHPSIMGRSFRVLVLEKEARDVPA